MSAERDDLLSASLDGALDRRGARRLQALESTDPGLWERRDELAYADASLRRALARSIEGPAPFEATDAIVHAPEPGWRPGGLAVPALAAAAGVILGAALTWGVLVGPVGGAVAGGLPWVDELAAEHRLHAPEEAPDAAGAGDEVAAWLGARLGRPVAVPDLTPLGLRFDGARLVLAGGEPAAQLLYEGGGAVVSLGLTARPGAGDTPFTERDFDDLQAVTWAQEGAALAVIGPTGGPSLLPVARLAATRL